MATRNPTKNRTNGNGTFRGRRLPIRLFGCGNWPASAADEQLYGVQSAILSLGFENADALAHVLSLCLTEMDRYPECGTVRNRLLSVVSSVD